MIPQHKNIQQRLAFAFLLVMGYIAILLYARPELISTTTVLLALLFGAIYLWVDDQMRNTIDTENS